MSEEKLLWSGSPSQVINIPAFVVLGLLFWLVVPVILIFWRWLNTHMTKYELTTERFRTRSGVLNKKLEELELYRVRDYRLEEPFYLRIFSLGNIVLQTPAGVQLANNYDFAGRVTATRSNEVGPAFSNPCVTAVTPSGGRLYVSNTYNNSTAGTSYGRLTSRVGSSFLQPGAGASYDVTDAFAYGGLGGRVSARTTTVSGSGLSTTQGWMYNGLALLAHHYHPRSSGQFPLVVSWGYDAGLPVKAYVNGIPMVKGVGYAPSGAVSAYTTGLGFGADVTTTITQDPLVPRPASIATSGASLNFSTGAYGYDGVGNIKKMGTIDSFGYDLQSRLTSATLQNLQGSTVSQAFSYDRYGNLLTKGATAYSVNASTNRLTTAGYDVRGNVTTNGGDTYAYDGLDRMQYNRISSGEWDYVYDAAGERLVKIPPLGASWALKR